MIKKLNNKEGVKQSSTLAGQRELIREMRNTINDLIASVFPTKLENPRDSSEPYVEDGKLHPYIGKDKPFDLARFKAQAQAIQDSEDKPVNKLHCCERHFLDETVAGHGDKPGEGWVKTIKEKIDIGYGEWWVDDGCGEYFLNEDALIDFIHQNFVEKERVREMTKDKIICSAIKEHLTGKVWFGERHHDCIWLMGKFDTDISTLDTEGFWVIGRGYNGRFVDRREAYQIAVELGKVPPATTQQIANNNTPELRSIDLW